MEVSSSRQVYVFLLCIISGLLCGAFFDIQRFLREKYKSGKTRTIVEDSLFALFCIVVVIGFGYLFNNGELRYFQLMGTLSGVLFYASVLSRAFKKVLNTVFILFVNLIFKPVKKIYRVLLIPFKMVLKNLRKLKNKKNKMMKRFSRHFKNRKKRLKKRIKML